MKAKIIMMKAKKFFNNNGFTLIDVVIYIFILFIVLISLTGILKMVTSICIDTDNTAKVTHQTQQLLTFIKNDMQRCDKVLITSGSSGNVKAFTLEDTKDLSSQGILAYPKIYYRLDDNKQLERKEEGGEYRRVSYYSGKSHHVYVEKLKLEQKESNLWILTIQTSAKKSIHHKKMLTEKIFIYLPNVN